MGTLGEMKGAAMKLGQMASFIDIEFLPPEYREIYQEQLAKLRTSAPPMPWEKAWSRSWRRNTRASRSPSSSARSRRRLSPPPRSARSTGPSSPTGAPVAVKIQYPGVAEALEADLRNAGTIMRLGKAIAPGLDPKAIAAELRERVLEELDYEHEAQDQRSFARAYRDHPFIYVPDVYTRLSRRRVLVTELGRGNGLRAGQGAADEERSRFGEIVFRFAFGSIYHLQHFNADTHPGNYILMPDGRVAFLDFGMTKRLDREQIVLEQRAVDAAVRKDPEGLREALHELGFVKNPSKLDAERLMEHVMVVGGWYLEDGEYEVTPRRVMKVIESTSDPRSEYFDLMRARAVPAEELMGRRMETGRAGGAGAAAGEAQLAPDHARVGLRRPARRPSWASRSGPTSSRAGSSAVPGSLAGGCDRARAGRGQLREQARVVGADPVDPEVGQLAASSRARRPSRRSGRDHRLRRPARGPR